MMKVKILSTKYEMLNNMKSSQHSAVRIKLKADG